MPFFPTSVKEAAARFHPTEVLRPAAPSPTGSCPPIGRRKPNRCLLVPIAAMPEPTADRTTHLHLRLQHPKPKLHHREAIRHPVASSHRRSRHLPRLLQTIRSPCWLCPSRFGAPAPHHCTNLPAGQPPPSSSPARELAAHARDGLIRPRPRLTGQSLADPIRSLLARPPRADPVASPFRSPRCLLRCPPTTVVREVLLLQLRRVPAAVSSALAPAGLQSISKQPFHYLEPCRANFRADRYCNACATEAI